MDGPELDGPGWNAPSDVERKRRAGRATAITAWLRDNAAGAQLEIRRRNCPGRLRAGGRHMENNSADARSCGNKPAASLAQSGKHGKAEATARAPHWTAGGTETGRENVGTPGPNAHLGGRFLLETTQ